jgi:hypothetical protein
MPSVNRKRSEAEDDTVVISFRAPRKLVEELDKFASGDQRTRANFIVLTLSHAVFLEPAIQTIAQILKPFSEEHTKNPDSVEAEHWRGVMTGARWMLGAFFGDRTVRWVNRKVREKTNLPMPHAVPLQADGMRYGFDSEADSV